MKHERSRSSCVAATIAAALLSSSMVAAATPDAEHVGEAASAITMNDRLLWNVGMDLCIASTGSNVVRTEECSRASNQRWDIVEAITVFEVLEIRSRDPLQDGKCLGIPGVTAGPGQFPVMVNCDSSRAGVWRFVNGKFCVFRRFATQPVCLQSGGAGDLLKLQASSSSENQKWMILP